MRIDKFVKQYQRAILGAIVALVALSMLITFVPGAGPKGAKNKDPALDSFVYRAIAGEAGEKVEVSRNEYAHMVGLSGPLIHLRAMMFDLDPRYFCGKLYISSSFLRGRQDPLLLSTLYAQYMGRTPVEFEFMDKDYNSSVNARVTWETLILLEHARRSGIVVPETEAHMMIPQLYRKWWMLGAKSESAEEYTKQNYIDWVKNLFPNNSPKEFEEAVEICLKISKLLNLQTMTEFASYRELYESQVKGSMKIRVRTAIIDPRQRELSFQLRPVQVEEIGKYYRANKERMKSPPMARVLYVGALYEKFKAKAGTIEEKALRDYYEAYKTDFKDGPPEKQRQQTFEEARPKVEQRWLREKLETDLYTLCYDLKNEISEEVGKVKDVKPADIEAIIAKKIEARAAKGEPFDYSYSDVFGKREAPELKRSTLGESSRVDTFALDPDRKEGDIYGGVDKTEKGCFFYMMHRKVAPKELPLTHRIEEDIRTFLQTQQLTELSKDYAKKAAKLTTDLGYKAASERYSLSFSLSGFFSPEGRGHGEEEALPNDGTLADQVRAAAQKLKSIGEATYASFERDKKTLYAVVVLDDQFLGPVEGIDEIVRSARTRANEDRRLTLKEQVRQATLRDSELDALLKRVGAQRGSDSPSAPPDEP